MPIIPDPVLTTEDSDKVTPIKVDVTLAVAGTSQTLFTVPVGQKLRAVSLLNTGPGTAHIRLVAGSPATAADVLLERRDTWAEEHLDLPDGTYAFINGGASNLPRVTGVVWTGPAV